jgi:hypothetical protein
MIFDVFWNFKQNRMVVFLSTFRNELLFQSLNVEIRPTGCPEMSVGNYHSSLRKIEQQLRCRAAEEQIAANVAAQAYEDGRKSESSDVLALMF